MPPDSIEIPPAPKNQGVPVPDGSVTVVSQGEAGNTRWIKTIPILNWITMVISVLLVFGLDLVILVSEFSLLPFWIEMLIVFGFFLIFFCFENFSFKKKFASTESSLDISLLVLIILRNIIVILNFIPFIQIAGAFAGAIYVVPYLVVYLTLLSIRFKKLPVAGASQL